MKVTVACVLRSGGDFTPSWARALKRGVKRYLPTDHHFMCLTDWHFDGVATRLLAHEWPGWWSKVDLFRPGLFRGPVLYLDLDTLPVGDLTDLTSYRGEFAHIGDLYHPDRFASGVMMWTPSEATEAIYHAFCREPERIMQAHPNRMDHWLAKVVPDGDRIQDLLPGQVVSLKGGTRRGRVREDVPDGARLVAGHGNPRLSDPAAGWAHELWRERAAGQRSTTLVTLDRVS